MKRKILISIIVFLIVTIILTLAFSDNFFKSGISYCQVSYGKLDKQYSMVATVNSNEHYQFFNGNIKSINYSVNDKVSKDSTILDYYDVYDKVQKLKSEYDGYLIEFSSNYVKIVDSSYYLQLEVKQEIYQQIDEKTTLVYLSGDNYYLASFISKSDKAIEKDGQLLFVVKFKPETDDLLLSQNVTVKLSIESETGLIVDSKAIFQDDQGDYLLDQDFTNDISNVNEHKIRIKVVYDDGSNALIEGFGLENLTVCVVDDTLRQVIEDASDN